MGSSWANTCTSIFLSREQPSQGPLPSILHCSASLLSNLLRHVDHGPQVSSLCWDFPRSSSTTVNTATSTDPNGIATPLPIQSGMAANSNKFVLINQGDTCNIVAFFNGPISTENFVL